MNGAIWLRNGSESSIGQEGEYDDMELGVVDRRRKREYPNQQERGDSASGYKKSKSGIGGGAGAESVERREGVGKMVVIVRFGEAEQRRMRAINPLTLTK